ncbi:MAG: AraC family transcriptional regulator [Flavobacteriales bacterium]|nr:AraC family transcriptional regulator [Flavobacteriales bacterium]
MQFHTHLLCVYGSLKFELNNEQFHCKADEFLFWFSGSVLSQLRFSKRFKAIILLVESSFLNDNVPDQNWSINAILYSRKNPVKSLNDKSLNDKIAINFQQIYQVFLDTKHTFYEEILKLQMRIFILEMWHIFSEHYEQYKYSLQTGTLYERFISLLEQHCMQEREVKFYAEKLFITPKYLNYICKTTTSITASEWIQRYVKERIELLLQNPNLNIAEIADEMEFSSRSFFTRYVKKLLDVTPSEYRSRFR